MRHSLNEKGIKIMWRKLILGVSFFWLVPSVVCGHQVNGVYYVSTESDITDHGDVNEADSLADILDDIGTTPATIEFPGDTTYTITTSVTIPSTVTLVFQHGAILAGAGTKTINGHIRAPCDEKIFDPSVGTVTFATNSVPFICVDWFGALPDGSTDSTTAIQKADAAAGTTGIPISFSPGTYRVDAISTNADPAIWRGANTTIKCNGTGANNESMIKFDEIANVTIEGITFDGNTVASKVVTIDDTTGVGDTVLIRDCIFKNGLQTNDTGLAAGLKIAGNYTTARITDSDFINIDSTHTSAPASRGLLVTFNTTYYVKNSIVDRCFFDDITPVDDGDCAFFSAPNSSLSEERASVSNSTFRDCSKRAIKSQIHSITVNDNFFERTQDFGGSNTSVVAAQYGGANIHNNRIHYSDGAYAPLSIFILGGAAMDFENPSIVNENVVWVGNTTALTDFAELSQADLATTAYTKITNNSIYGNTNYLVQINPDGRASAAVTFDHILVQGNFVRDISGTNAALININRSGGAGEYADVRMKVLDNVVDGSSDVDAMYTPDANTNLLSIEWARNFHVKWPTSYVYGLPNSDTEIQRKIEFSDTGDSTPSVQVDRDNVFFQFAYTSAMDIDGFDDGYVGQVIVCRDTTGNATIKMSGSNFLGDGSVGDLSLDTGDVVVFLYHTSEKWVLIGHIDISTY